MKKFMFTLIAMTVSSATWAQGVPVGFMDDPVNHPMTPIYVVGVLILVVLVLIMVIAIYLLRVINMLTQQALRVKAEQADVPYTTPKSYWVTWWEKINAVVPVEKEKDIELDHDFDGIRELDNHLPPWWKWLFYGTMVWAVIYLFVFHVYHWLPLSVAEYENEVARAEEQKRRIEAMQPVAAIDLDKLEFIDDPAMIEKGKSVFLNLNCGSCHRNDGGGNAIGPNLTDAYWLHGGSARDIYVTVRDGVVEKGMPAWGKAISATDVRDVTFFIMSLQGSNPPDAKAPQGERYEADKGENGQASL